MKRISWVFVVVGVLFLLPGLLTWSFAEHEATSFGSDWVMISTPLIIIAFACIGWGLRRGFGNIGLAVGGGAGLVVLGVLMFILSSSIDARVAWRDQVRRLDDTISFCESGPTPHPDARPYEAGMPNPTVVFTSSGISFSREYSDYLSWAPDVPRVDHTALVGCIEDTRTELETCQYSEGRQLHRIRVDRSARLYALSTGELIAEQAFPGGNPDGCHMIEEFYGGGDNSKVGEVATDEQVLAFLRPHAGH